MTYELSIEALEVLVKALQNNGVDIELTNFVCGNDMKWLTVNSVDIDKAASVILTKVDR